eukprot:g13493.t1
MNNTKILHPCIGSTGYFQRPDVANSLRPPPAALFEQRLIKKHYYRSIKNVKPIVHSKFQKKRQQRKRGEKNKTKTGYTSTNPSLSSSLKNAKKPFASHSSKKVTQKKKEKNDLTKKIQASPIKLLKLPVHTIHNGSILYPLSNTVAKKRQAKLRIHNRKKRLKRLGNRRKHQVEKPQWNDNVYDIPKPKPEIPINRHPDKTHIQSITKHMPTASHHNSVIPGIKKLGANIHPQWKKRHKGKALLRDMFGNLEVNQDSINDQSFRYIEHLKEYRLKKLHNQYKTSTKKKQLKTLQEKVTSMIKTTNAARYALNHTDDDGTKMELHLPDEYHHEYSIPSNATLPSTASKRYQTFTLTAPLLIGKTKLPMKRNETVLKGKRIEVRVPTDDHFGLRFI